MKSNGLIKCINILKKGDDYGLERVNKSKANELGLQLNFEIKHE